MSDPMKIDIEALLGHCILRSWFETRNDESGEYMVGMGEKCTFDRHGILVSREVSESGVVLRWESEAKKKRSIFERALNAVRRWI